MKNLNLLINTKLTKSVEKYDKLSNFVYEFMHLDKKKHHLWIVVKGQDLTILTDNPYLGMQLKYQQDAICLALNKQFLLQLKTQKVKIVPPTSAKEKSNKKLFEVSEKSSAALSSIANTIEDNELKKCLLTLTKKHHE